MATLRAEPRKAGGMSRPPGAQSPNGEPAGSARSRSGTGDPSIQAAPGPSHDLGESSTSHLEAVVSTFEKWLHMPDRLPLLAVLGTVAANRMDGDPVWLLLVGPPASGKTEILESTRDLPDMHAVATLTEAALLSGTPAREKSKDARG